MNKQQTRVINSLKKVLDRFEKVGISLAHVDNDLVVLNTRKLNKAKAKAKDKWFWGDIQEHLDDDDMLTINFKNNDGTYGT